MQDHIDRLLQELEHYAAGGDVHPHVEQMARELADHHAKGGSTGYLTHTKGAPNEEVGNRYDVSEARGMAPKEPFDIEKYKGSSAMLMPWDSTSRNVDIRGVSGRDLPEAVTTHGGQDYARDLEHIGRGISGASGIEIAKRIATREAIARMENEQQGGTGRILHMPVTMGDRAEDFSMTPTQILHHLVHMGDLHPKELQRMNDEIRAHKVIKTGKTVQPFTGFVGLEHPDFHRQIMTGEGIDTTPGELRKAIVDRIGYKKQNQKALGFNMEDIVGAVTDPALRGVPKGFIGNTVIGSDPDHMSLTPSGKQPYDTNFSGEYLGSMGHSFPAEMLFGKHIENLRNQFEHKPGDTRTMALGALEKRNAGVSQLLDNETLDNYGKFMAKRAKWAKQGGYAEGGEVGPSYDDMLAHVMLHKADGGSIRRPTEMGVDEAPNSDIKWYMPPAAGEGNMPVGGVDFNPSEGGQQFAPEQAQGQPPQGAPGQPQGMQPPAGPQAPAGPPSNILNMTPQGQAMAAMKAPQATAPVVAKPNPSPLIKNGMARMAKGGSAKPVVRGIIKEQVTVIPNLDEMRYALLAAKKAKR